MPLGMNSTICLAAVFPSQKRELCFLHNFTDEPVILKEGKRLRRQFYPLNRDFGSLNSFSIEVHHETGHNGIPNRWSKQGRRDEC